MQSLLAAAGCLLCFPEQSAVQVGCGALRGGGGRGPIQAFYPGPWLHNLQCSLPLGKVGGETVSFPGGVEPEQRCRLVQSPLQ